MVSTSKLKFVASFALLLVLSLGAQAQMQKNRGDIFPHYGNYEKKGWIVQPGFSYMLRPLKQTQSRLWVASDSVYDVSFNAKGRIGPVLEIGRFYAIETSKIISYVDFSVGGKMLRGQETFEAVLDDPDRAQPYVVEGVGTYSQTYVTASFNATNTLALSKSMAVHNSLGINGDYSFASVYEYDVQDIPVEQNEPTNFIFQAHYKLGFGFKVSQSVFVVPSVEVPILTMYEYDDMKSNTLIFNSRYRPFLFRINVMVLDKKADRKCPTKKTNRKKSESLFGSKRPW